MMMRFLRLIVVFEILFCLFIHATFPEEDDNDEDEDDEALITNKIQMPSDSEFFSPPQNSSVNLEGWDMRMIELAKKVEVAIHEEEIFEAEIRRNLETKIVLELIAEVEGKRGCFGRNFDTPFTQIENQQGHVKIFVERTLNCKNIMRSDYYFQALYSLAVTDHCTKLIELGQGKRLYIWEEASIRISSDVTSLNETLISCKSPEIFVTLIDHDETLVQINSLIISGPNKLASFWIRQEKHWVKVVRQVITTFWNSLQHDMQIPTFLVIEMYFSKDYQLKSIKLLSKSELVDFEESIHKILEDFQNPAFSYDRVSYEGKTSNKQYVWERVLVATIDCSLMFESACETSSHSTRKLTAKSNLVDESDLSGDLESKYDEGDDDILVDIDAEAISDEGKETKANFQDLKEDKGSVVVSPLSQCIPVTDENTPILEPTNLEFF